MMSAAFSFMRFRQFGDLLGNAATRASQRGGSAAARKRARIGCGPLSRCSSLTI